MANTSKQVSISGTSERKSSNGNSILLRLNPDLASALRTISKREERTLTTVMSRAFREYIAKNYSDIKISNEAEAEVEA